MAVEPTGAVILRPCRATGRPRRYEFLSDELARRGRARCATSTPRRARPRPSSCRSTSSSPRCRSRASRRPRPRRHVARRARHRSAATSSAPTCRVTVDWATAKALLVDGNPQAAMGAFMEGKVRIEGDVGEAHGPPDRASSTPSTQEAARADPRRSRPEPRRRPPARGAARARASTGAPRRRARPPASAAPTRNGHVERGEQLRRGPTTSVSPRRA